LCFQVEWPRLTGRHQSLMTPRSTTAGTRLDNMFARLKDWRRLHTCYDRCAHTFVSAIFLAAVVIFWRCDQ
jgi:transposase